MFNSAPAAFAGSTPSGPSSSSKLPYILDLTFGVIAVLTASAIWTGLSLSGAFSVQTMVIVSLLGGLVPTFAGLLLVDQAAEQPHLWTARIYNQLRQRLEAGPGPAAVGRSTDEDVYQSIANLTADAVFRVSRLQADRDHLEGAAATTNEALQAGRDQARQLALCLRHDGETVATAASGLINASTRLHEDATAARQGSLAAEHAVSGLIDRAVGLTAAISIVTAQVGRMSDFATRGAETAFGAQRSLISLNDKVVVLSRSADQVARVLELAGECGRTASEQATGDGTEAGVSAELAADLRNMASNADQALAAMQAMVAGLRSEAALASRRLAELSELIRGQHEIGDVLGNAIEQQGQEVAQVLTLVSEARAGVSMLRDGVEALASGSTDHVASAETLRGMADRLPGHADTIAAILRGIPDFQPPRQT